MRHKSWIIIILFLTIPLSGRCQVTFVIEHLPVATPTEDSIFITGTFNDWKMSPQYMFRKRLDGKLAVTLPAGLTNFEYKFTRGSWAKAETGEHNAFLPNRIYGGTENVIGVSIQNWQDVAGARPVSVFVFYFFTMSLIVLLTRYVIARIKTPNESLNNSILEFQIALSAALFGRAAMEVLPPEWSPYLIHFGEVLVVFCCIPFLDLTRRAAGQRPLSAKHFLPLSIFFAYQLLKTFNVPGLSFLNEQPVENLTWDDLLVNSFILGSLTWYWLKAFLVILKSLTENRMLDIFLRIHLALGGLFISAFVAVAALDFSGNESTFIFRDLLPLCGSLFVGVTCWFAVNRSEIFRITPSELRHDELQRLAKYIDEIMKTEKLYLNPNLSLGDLSARVGLKPHALSRALNDGHLLSFRDFVNSYRVNEFIRMASLPSSKKYTWLALAFEVGFNSKSTFNAAFKKNTDMSPREYFQQLKDNSLTSNNIKSPTL